MARKVIKRTSVLDPCRVKHRQAIHSAFLQVSLRAAPRGRRASDDANTAYAVRCALKLDAAAVVAVTPATAAARAIAVLVGGSSVVGVNESSGTDRSTSTVLGDEPVQVVVDAELGLGQITIQEQ